MHCSFICSLRITQEDKACSGNENAMDWTDMDTWPKLDRNWAHDCVGFESALD